MRLDEIISNKSCTYGCVVMGINVKEMLLVCTPVPLFYVASCWRMKLSTYTCKEV